MRKNEYVSPKMEIVKLGLHHGILVVSGGDLGDQTKDPNLVPED